MSKLQDIRRQVAARDITHLLHFTPMGNIQSILQNGLVSRPVLDEHGIDYLYTDGMREDKKPNAVSLSISEVNYSMLAAKRKNYRGSWVILAFDPSVLWTHSCRFCWANAASKDVRDYTRFLGGPWGFNRMFQSAPVSARDQRCQREVYEIPDASPTDNAAEVQVFNGIDSDLIIAAGVRTAREKTELEKLMVKLDHVRPVEVVDKILT